MDFSFLIFFYTIIHPYFDSYIYLFILTILVDFFTDFINFCLSTKSVKFTQIFSVKRLLKDGLVILLVLIFYIYFSIFEFDSYAQLLISFYIAHYGLSILENLNAIGIPVPEFIKKNINKFK
ncbi:phage holin family protein [Carnobacterium sp. FSL W8-0810]|uniref:phage holin family protein n=1 Tax=Carnobacterium sp. FSL W8-0810 TaxID=2954705 RepID=UPI004046FB37